jgi:hypothetical protein
MRKPSLFFHVCGLLLAAVLIGGCRKEGFTRLMDVELKYRVVPDAERIPLGDTVRIIAWLPYQQFDRATNTMVDIRNMEAQSWGSVGYWAMDSATNEIIHKKGGHIFENYFSMNQPYGTFRDYPKNNIIGNMHKNDTAFYFELRLIAQKAWVHMLRPSSGRGFMENGRFRIDIAARVINPNFHQHLIRKYDNIITPYDRDYFFETY